MRHSSAKHKVLPDVKIEGILKLSVLTLKQLFVLFHPFFLELEFPLESL